MAKADPSTFKDRKRRLNLIYFIDSARTRSITMSLRQVSVLLGGGILLILWSVVSVVLIVFLFGSRAEQAGRLREALGTIFEYETRDDKVFDLAYPPASRAPNAETGVAEDAPLEVKAAAAAKAATALLAGVGQGDGEETPAPPADAAPQGKAGAGVPARGAAVTDTGTTPAGRVTAVATAADNGKGTELAVSVANPVLEPRSSALELHFDLANKSGSDRVEGLIWAVAEFQTDGGTRIFIGAPAEIQVNAAGEPAFPQRSAPFGIRRFKQKDFSFPFPPGETGTFVAVRIGVMDRSGGGKATYNVPVKIHVGEG